MPQLSASEPGKLRAYPHARWKQWTGEGPLLLMVSQPEPGKSPNVSTLPLGCVTSLDLFLLGVTTLSLMTGDCRVSGAPTGKCLACSCYFGELWKEDLTLRGSVGTRNGGSVAMVPSKGKPRAPSVHC